MTDVDTEPADYDDYPEPPDRDERAAQLIGELAELLGVQRETAALAASAPVTALLRIKCDLCGSVLLMLDLRLDPGVTSEMTAPHYCAGATQFGSCQSVTVTARLGA